MDKNSYSLLVAIGKCHWLLKDHADRIVSQSAVKKVTRWSDMPYLRNVFRLEEYVDAELLDGEAISCCLQLTVALDVVCLEADVRRIHNRGQDVLVKIADREFTNLAECSQEMIEVTERLCAAGLACLTVR